MDVVRTRIGAEALDQEAVRLRAYHIWVDRGRPSGTHDEDWHQAERELLAELDASTPAKTNGSSAGATAQKSMADASPAENEEPLPRPKKAKATARKSSAAKARSATAPIEVPTKPNVLPAPAEQPSPAPAEVTPERSATKKKGGAAKATPDKIKAELSSPPKNEKPARQESDGKAEKIEPVQPPESELRAKEGAAKPKVTETAAAQGTTASPLPSALRHLGVVKRGRTPRKENA